MNKYSNKRQFTASMTPDTGKQIPGNRCPICGFSVGNGNWCVHCARDIGDE